MSFMVMPKSALNPWVDKLLGEYRVMGPQLRRDRYVFDDLHVSESLEPDYTTTILPPKKFLLPQQESLFTFDLDSGDIEPVLETEPTVLLGLHTCDLHAIRLLDTVYGGDYADQHYLARRENTVLISIECLTPCSEYSFCKSMGSLSVTDGFDLHLTSIGDSYAVDIGTEKGAALLQSIDDVSSATDEDYDHLNRTLSEKWPRFSYRLDMDISDLANLLSVSYKSDMWDELGEKCLACGACTAVCPTCYCFTVDDEIDFSLNAGTRIRRWDGCPLVEFALVAGGHNFREANAARQRHRFLRKGKFQMEAHQLVGCVGCGRCAQACLVDINPVSVFNELAERRVPLTRRHQEAMS